LAQPEVLPFDWCLCRIITTSSPHLPELFFAAVQVHLNRARSHLDGAAHLHGEEVTVRIV